MAASSAMETESFDHDGEKHSSATTLHECTQARLLHGGPVIANIASWCQKHNRHMHGQKATLAVLYFDTGADADEYLYIKAVVAAKAGIDCVAYKLLPHASTEEVLDAILGLNEDDHIHGILIQRPIPAHLCEDQIMRSVRPVKHIEEYSREKPNNIAYDGLYRLLQYYDKARMLRLRTLLLGGTNIITPGFRAQLHRQHKHVQTMEILDPEHMESKHDTIIFTELNEGGAIKPHMIKPEVRLVVDLGFDVITKVGDLDPDVLDLDDLDVVPTPHGVLPVLLWVMMQRTIQARDRLLRPKLLCLPDCAVL